MQDTVGLIGAKQATANSKHYASADRTSCIEHISDPTGNTTRKRTTFVNTTAIAYRQNHEAPADFLPVYNSSCVHKRHAFASTDVLPRSGPRFSPR